MPTAARAAPGVLAVLTAADVRRRRAAAAAALGRGQCRRPASRSRSRRSRCWPSGKVRYVGEPVALVVAETRAQALDAAELVAVDYSPLPAVTTAAAARAPGAPQLRREVPGNLCFDWRTGDSAAVDAAFAAAAHVVETRPRQSPHRHQPDGAARRRRASTTRRRGRYTAHVSSQSIHATATTPRARWACRRAQVRFVAPDVGGGFGAKNFIYPEHVLIPWAAKRVGRPVKWIATRSEVFLADHQARDHRAEAALALDADGQLSGAARRQHRQCSAPIWPAARAACRPSSTSICRARSTASRRSSCRSAAVLTNTAPIGVTARPGLCRGGQHHRAADRRGGPAMRLRPRRVAPPQHGAGRRDADDQRVRQSRSTAAPSRRPSTRRWRRPMSAGFAGAAPGERGARPAARPRLRLSHQGHRRLAARRMSTSASRRTARVSLITGTQTIGQGHETTFPQILADRLGVPNELIRLRPGRHRPDPASAAGTAARARPIWAARRSGAPSDEIIAKGTRIAADALEAAEADIRFEDGRFRRVGHRPRGGAARCRGDRARRRATPLDTYHAWTREWMTFPNGTHVVEVEIDRDTGAGDARPLHRGRRLRRAGQPDDRRRPGARRDRPGRRPGPARARGLRPGVRAADRRLVHGLRDAARRRPAVVQPRLQPTRCTTNPLGVKGCGEAGAVAAFPAIANAILDALAPLGGADFDGPATPARVWRAMQG